MKTYLITWYTGAVTKIQGKNYVNALYVNHISPSMKELISSYVLV